MKKYAIVIVSADATIDLNNEVNLRLDNLVEYYRYNDFHVESIDYRAWVRPLYVDRFFHTAVLFYSYFEVV